MLGSDILEIGLGLVLVYLLMSLMMTAVQEGLEHLLRRRARNLERAILELLQGDQNLLHSFYDHPLVYALHRGSRAPDSTPPGAAPAEASASQAPVVSARDLPSYIPRETFSAVFIDLMVKQGGSANPHLRRAYDGLKGIAGEDARKLRKEVEGWYDGAMDRASGWFKRHSQLSLFLLGLGASVLLNVNSVTIARHLATDPQARHFADQLAEQVAREGLPEKSAATDSDTDAVDAESLAAGNVSSPDANAAAAEKGAGPASKKGPASPAPAAKAAGAGEEPAAESPSDSYAKYKAQLDEIGLPIGWDDAALKRIDDGFPKKLDKSQKPTLGYLASCVLAAIVLLLGYLVTALAVMLGAPFWFDVLNKIMVIRGTVKPKEKSPDEPPVDGPNPRKEDEEEEEKKVD